jgi:hypothetical protein
LARADTSGGCSGDEADAGEESSLEGATGVEGDGDDDDDEDDDGDGSSKEQSAPTASE